jgi:large subunit ribosomal protein L13
MRTLSAKKNEVSRHWYVVDATDQPLGRLASRVARVLRGKHRPDYTPHMDAGDFVVIVNAEKILLTGDKKRTKIFYRHSGHPGGIWAEPYGQLLQRQPAFAVEKAIRGMLPKNRLGKTLSRKLKVYAGPVHPHAAQKPEPFTF